MGTRLKGRLSLLLLSFVAVMLVFPAMAFAQGAPTIQSDKADYAPGETVILTGSNWQPGESVNIYVNDNEGKTWERNVDVTADESGNIRDEFQLPDWFVATYKVTATGAQSGVATTSFTDGNIRVVSSPANTPEVLFDLTYTIHKGATQSTTDNNCASDSFDDQPQTETVGSSNQNRWQKGVSENHSVRLEAAHNANQPSGWTFKEWTGPTGSFFVIDPNNPRVICATGNFTGTRDLQAVYQGPQAPVAKNDSYNVNEDNTLNIAAPGVLGNDTDANGDTLTAVKVSNPANGSVTLNANGSFSYAPNANYSGPDSFTYKANDGGLDSNVATVSITVDAVNDAPVNSVPGPQFTNEDTALTFSNANGNQISISDVDAGANQVRVQLSVPNGTLTLSGTTGLTFVGGANGSPNMAFTGTITNINNALNGMSFTPNANFNGPALPLLIVTNDQGFSGAGGPLQDGDPVPITVRPVNDVPVANDDTRTMNEDGPPISIDLGALVSDVETSDANLTYNIVSGPTAQQGTLTVTNTNGVYSFDSADNFFGTVEISYKVTDRGDPDNCSGPSPGCDGPKTSAQKTVTITVRPVNDAPKAEDDSAETDEDTPAKINVLFNDTDVDGDALSVVANSLSDPANGSVELITTGPDQGKVLYTPDANFNGSDFFTYKASDGSLESNVATVSITVKAVNDAPVANDDSYTTDEDTDLVVSAANGLLKNDEDVENDALHVADGNADAADGISPVSGPSHGQVTLNANGSFTYKPDANFFGNDSFTYKVCDNGSPQKCSVETAEVKITINPVNDAPVANGDSYNVDEDNTLTVPAADGVLKNDTDVESDPLTAAKVSDPAHGSLTLNSNGSFSYTPQANYNGPDSFTYKANDGNLESNVATVSITVKAVNDAPTVKTPAVDDTGKNEGATLSTQGAFQDAADNDTLTITKTAGAGTVVDNGDGTWSWSLQTRDNISGSVTVTASDGKGGTATDTFNYSTVNVAPTASNGTFVLNPILGTATAGFSFSDAGFDDTHALSYFTWSDIGNQPAAVTETNGAGQASATRTLTPGCYNLTVTGTAKDDDLAESAPLTIYSNSQTSVHGMAFLPPIMDNERNIAKYGNVVPVKVQLTNTCTGGTVTNVTLYITLHKGSGNEVIEDNNPIAESVSSADTGSQMRVVDGRYMYNLSTRNMTANSDWTVRVRLGSTTGPVLLQAVFYPKK